MVQNFALAAIVALFATATLADSAEKKEEHAADTAKDATVEKKADEEKKTDEAKK